MLAKTSAPAESRIAGRAWRTAARSEWETRSHVQRSLQGAALSAIQTSSSVPNDSSEIELALARVCMSRCEGSRIRVLRRDKTGVRWSVIGGSGLAASTTNLGPDREAGCQSVLLLRH